MCKVHIIYEFKVRHITKFSDALNLGCGNCRETTVEDCTTNCESQATTYYYIICFVCDS